MNKNCKIETQLLGSPYSADPLIRLKIDLGYSEIDLALRISDGKKLVLFLQNARKKYLEWKEIAIKNNVKSHIKEIESFTFECRHNDYEYKLTHCFLWKCRFCVSLEYGIKLINEVVNGVGFHWKSGWDQYLSHINNMLVNMVSWVGDNCTDKIYVGGKDKIVTEAFLGQPSVHHRTLKKERCLERSFYLTDEHRNNDVSSTYSLSFIEILEEKINDTVNSHKREEEEKYNKSRKAYEESAKRYDEYKKIDNLFR
jgi:hypothetical protein